MSTSAIGSQNKEQLKKIDDKQQSIKEQSQKADMQDQSKKSQLQKEILERVLVLNKEAGLDRAAKSLAQNLNHDPSDIPQPDPDSIIKSLEKFSTQSSNTTIHPEEVHQVIQELQQTINGLDKTDPSSKQVAIELFKHATNVITAKSNEAMHRSPQNVPDASVEQQNLEQQLSNQNPNSQNFDPSDSAKGHDALEKFYQSGLLSNQGKMTFSMNETTLRKNNISTTSNISVEQNEFGSIFDVAKDSKIPIFYFIMMVMSYRMTSMENKVKIMGQKILDTSAQLNTMSAIQQMSAGLLKIKELLEKEPKSKELQALKYTTVDQLFGDFVLVLQGKKAYYTGQDNTGKIKELLLDGSKTDEIRIAVDNLAKIAKSAGLDAGDLFDVDPGSTAVDRQGKFYSAMQKITEHINSIITANGKTAIGSIIFTEFFGNKQTGRLPNEAQVKIPSQIDNVSTILGTTNSQQQLSIQTDTSTLQAAITVLHKMTELYGQVMQQISR